MAKESKNIITTICDEHCNMSDRLLPKHCAALIAEVRFLTATSFLGHRLFFWIFRQNATNAKKYDACNIRKSENLGPKSIHVYICIRKSFFYTTKVKIFQKFDGFTSCIIHY